MDLKLITMEEDLPILKQVFNLCLWLQMNTKLESIITLDGKSDILDIKVFANEKKLIDFELVALTKKSGERVVIELKLIVAQLIELKNNKHYQL